MSTLREHPFDDNSSVQASFKAFVDLKAIDAKIIKTCQTDSFNLKVGSLSIVMSEHELLKLHMSFRCCSIEI